MSDKSLRRFWQIHLSTAIVMMLVAAIVLWRNVACPEVYISPDGEEMRAYGWPFALITVRKQQSEVLHRHSLTGRASAVWPIIYKDYFARWIKVIIVEALSIVMLFALVVIPLEYIIRRRERGRA